MRSTILSGLLLEYSPMGWPSVFYTFGGIGVLWFILWVLLCYNDPQSHPFISEEERNYLEKTIGKGLSGNKVNISRIVLK